MLLSGCGTQGGGPIDAGPDAGDAGAMTAARVTVGYEDESGSGWVLETANLGVGTITLHNDRGGTFDPELLDVGPVSIQPESEVVFDEAIPATYGRVTLDLEPGTWGYSFSFQLRLVDDVYIVRSSEPLSFEARCDVPITSTSSSVLDIGLVLPIDELIALMDDASLPSTMGTPMVLDDSTAPSLIDSVAAWLVDAWSADCALEESSG